MSSLGHSFSICAENNVFSRLCNVLLRGASLVAKLVLILFLSKYLTLEDVGSYGLFLATVMYCSSLLGLEFYTYSTRELLNTNKKEWNGIVKNSITFYLCSYFLVLPATMLIFYYGILPSRMAIYFYPILILEHISLEFNRLYVALLKNILASTLIFLRTSLWVFFLVPIIVFLPQYRNIETVFQFWLIGDLMSCVLGFVKFNKIITGESAKNNVVDFKWITAGVKYSLLIYLSSQSIILIYTLDKFFIKYFGSLEMLSAYILFLGISNAVISFLESAVFVFYYPKLIKAYFDRSWKDFDLVYKMMTNQVVVFGICFVGLVYLFIDYLLLWLGKEVYIDNLPILLVLLLSSLVKSYAMVQHYALYATRNDKYNVFLNFMTLLVFLLVILVSLLLNIDSLYTVPVSMLIAFFLQFIFKYYCWVKIKNNRLLFQKCLTI